MKAIDDASPATEPGPRPPFAAPSLLPWLFVSLGPVVALAEWPYQLLSEAGFQLQQRWWGLSGAIADRLPPSPGVEAWWGPTLVFVATTALLVLAWGPLASGRGGGVAPIIALDLASDDPAVGRREQWFSKLAPTAQLQRLALMTLARAGGLTVGVESPSAALGAGLLLALRGLAGERNPLARLSPERIAVIGGAAGLGTAFRSPLLGALYALEELGKRSALSPVLPVLLVAGSGTFVATRLGQPARLPGRSLGGLSPDLQGHAVVLTLVGAVAGAILVRLLAWLAGCVGRRMVTHRISTASLLAAALASIAVASDGLSLNDGSLSLGEALQGRPGGPPLTFAWRMLSTLLSVASGAPGGIMHDAMTLGALLTSPLAGVQGLGADALARLAAIGATALFAGANGTPIFCAVFVFTLQGDPLLLPVLLLASAVAAAIAAPLRGDTWNEHQAETLLRNR